MSSAFTLVELLVVVGIIGILAGLLLPALARAKAKGQTVTCLNNHRQLTLACLVYTDDHEDGLPYNLGDVETRRTVAQGRFLNWVNNVLSWELDPDNTNVAWVTTGGLGPYTAGAVSIYRCPTDSILSDIQQDAGWRGRVRSISMNATVGDAGYYTRYGTNVNVPGYQQFFRLGQIPDPSRIFLFTEEHPDSVDDGYFLNNPSILRWHDLPASYHDGAANISFADGHVEIHRWTQPSTRQPHRPDAVPLPMAIPPGERADFDWLMERTSVPLSQFGK